MAADDDDDAVEPWVEEIARRFHEAYERLAPDFGYETRRASAVPWGDVPEQNKQVMRAVVMDVFRVGLAKGCTCRGDTHTLGGCRAGEPLAFALVHPWPVDRPVASKWRTHREL